MKGARSHLHVIWLQDHAALIGPEPLQGKNKTLERTFRAHVRGHGVHGRVRSLLGDMARGTVSAGGPGIKAMAGGIRRDYGQSPDLR
jgi:hypothetical protein